MYLRTVYHYLQENFETGKLFWQKQLFYEFYGYEQHIDFK